MGAVCPLKPRCCPRAPARKISRSIYEGARDLAREIAKTEAYQTSRHETMRQISAQMEREGHFEFRRRSDGSVSIHMTNDDAPRRLMELMEAAGLLRDDA
jgi:hypothetical protein